MPKTLHQEIANIVDDAWLDAGDLSYTDHPIVHYIKQIEQAFLAAVEQVREATNEQANLPGIDPKSINNIDDAIYAVLDNLTQEISGSASSTAD